MSARSAGADVNNSQLFDQYKPTALPVVTKLLVIEQLLHLAPKSTVSAP